MSLLSLPIELYDLLSEYLWVPNPNLKNIQNRKVISPDDPMIGKNLIMEPNGSKSIFKHRFSPECPLFLLSLTCGKFYDRFGRKVKSRSRIHQTLSEYASYYGCISILQEFTYPSYFKINHILNSKRILKSLEIQKIATIYPLTQQTLTYAMVSSSDNNIGLTVDLLSIGCPQPKELLTYAAMYSDLDTLKKLLRINDKFNLKLTVSMNPDYVKMYSREIYYYLKEKQLLPSVHFEDESSWNHLEDYYNYIMYEVMKHPTDYQQFVDDGIVRRFYDRVVEQLNVDYLVWIDSMGWFSYFVRWDIETTMHKLTNNNIYRTHSIKDIGEFICTLVPILFRSHRSLFNLTMIIQTDVPDTNPTNMVHFQDGCLVSSVNTLVGYCCNHNLFSSLSLILDHIVQVNPAGISGDLYYQMYLISVENTNVPTLEWLDQRVDHYLSKVRIIPRRVEKDTIYSNLPSPWELFKMKLEHPLENFIFVGTKPLASILDWFQSSIGVQIINLNCIPLYHFNSYRPIRSILNHYGDTKYISEQIQKYVEYTITQSIGGRGRSIKNPKATNFNLIGSDLYEIMNSLEYLSNRQPIHTFLVSSLVPYLPSPVNPKYNLKLVNGFPLTEANGNPRTGPLLKYSTEYQGRDGENLLVNFSDYLEYSIKIGCLLDETVMVMGAAYNRIDVVQWYLDRIQNDPKLYLAKVFKECLIIACHYGHRSMVEWLLTDSTWSKYQLEFITDPGEMYTFRVALWSSVLHSEDLELMNMIMELLPDLIDHNMIKKLFENQNIQGLARQIGSQFLSRGTPQSVRSDQLIDSIISGVQEGIVISNPSNGTPKERDRMFHNIFGIQNIFLRTLTRGIIGNEYFDKREEVHHELIDSNIKLKRIRINITKHTFQYLIVTLVQ